MIKLHKKSRFIGNIGFTEDKTTPLFPMEKIKVH